MSSLTGAGRSLYSLHEYDVEKKKEGMQLITSPRQARELNEAHYGIFWTINRFNGLRKKENLAEIISLAADLDAEPKKQQAARIKQFLDPTFIIESSRSYHAYYDVHDVTPESFEEVMMDHLVPNLLADRKAADISRVLRVPFFNHCKDPENLFEVKIVHQTSAKYTEAEIRKAFPVPQSILAEREKRTSLKQELSFQKDSGLWARIWNLDCEHALTRLSGTPAVGGETIEFVRAPRGALNMVIDGKLRSCWVDAEKRIGSTDRGGPTIWQFVNWYHRDHKKTYQYLKQYLPELFDE